MPIHFVNYYSNNYLRPIPKGETSSEPARRCHEPHHLTRCGGSIAKQIVIVIIIVIVIVIVRVIVNITTQDYFKNTIATMSLEQITRIQADPEGSKNSMEDSFRASPESPCQRSPGTLTIILRSKKCRDTFYFLK